MSLQITEAFVQQWTRGITHLAQQKMSRFRNAVRRVPILSGDRVYVDQIGKVTAQPYTTRHGDTPLVDTPHSRRRITPTPYKHADLVDKSDLIRTLNDPTSDYMQAFGWAFGRAIDDVQIAAAFATAATGVDGSTSTSFDSNYQIAAGGTGLTMAKLIAANRLLRAAENDPDEGFYIAVSQEQIEDLLLDSTFTSADYNTIRALATGDVRNTFMGFNWIPSERLLVNGASARRCIAWAKNSLALAIAQDPSGRISERDDKNYSTQVFMSMDLGATRMDETGVVEVLCVE